MDAIQSGDADLAYATARLLAVIAQCDDPAYREEVVSRYLRRL